MSSKRLSSHLKLEASRELVLGGPVDLTGAAGAIMIERQAAIIPHAEPGTSTQDVKCRTYQAFWLDTSHSCPDMLGIPSPSVIIGRDRRTELAIRPSGSPSLAPPVCDSCPASRTDFNDS